MDATELRDKLTAASRRLRTEDDALDLLRALDRIEHVCVRRMPHLARALEGAIAEIASIALQRGLFSGSGREA
jgi:hypothetical protein